MFQASLRPLPGAQLQKQPLVLSLVAVLLVQKHGYHNDPTVKSEAASAVVELLMIGVRTPENVEPYINVK